MMLRCSYISISQPKIGNSKDENEDSVLVPSFSELESDVVIKFAISDGATEASFSKEWSNLLVRYYKSYPFDFANLPATISTISEEWQLLISGKELPWYVQEKLQYGAFATFLGMTLNLEKQTFEAVSIGDCNLFLVRNNRLKRSFPNTSFKDFGNTPALFATNPRFQADFKESVKYLNAEIESGDLLILATDALSFWILKRLSENCNPWLSLAILLNSKNYVEDFKIWIFDKISEREIKNDDISVVLINIE